MPSELVASWQARMDREFPHGAIASWETRSTVTYLVPRVMVTGQQGLDPEIWLPVFAGSDKTLGPFTVLSVQQLQRDPHMIRVVLDDDVLPLLLNAGVSPEAAHAMAADRQRFTELAPQGGTAVLGDEAA